MPRPGPRIPAILLAVAACAGPALAQESTLTPAPVQAQPDPYDGMTVAEIRLEHPVAGGKTEPVDAALAQLIRNTISLGTGLPYRRDTVESDLRKLNRLGRFDRITTTVEVLPGGDLAVTYIVVERSIVRDVQCVGNRLLSDQDIMEAAGAIIGTPVDPFQIDRLARGIEDLYRKKGYYLAQVTVDDKSLAQSGLLILRVREGERLKVTDIRFDGNRSFSPRELKSAIKTREATPLLEKGTLDDDVLASDVAGLVSFYRDRGYLDARADRRVQPSPNNREAIVTFLIDEGPLYSLGSVQMHFVPEGPGRFDQKQIAGLMLIKSGDVYSADKLTRSTQAVLAAYHKLGYNEADLGRQEVRDLERPVVDLVITIDEGTPTKVGEVRILGNDTTRQDVILRQLEVLPDRPLDKEAIDQSKENLENLALFEPGSIRLTVQPPDPDRPDTRDVVVEVKETNTGVFNIGAAIDSDSGIIGQISIVERNFDITNPPDSFGDLFHGGFRGGGQTLNLALMPGDQVQEYSISLTEPHILDTDNFLSGRLSYRFRDYTRYDEERYGGKITLGRNFGTRWQGDVYLRDEWVNLSDLADDAPVDYTDVADLNLVSTVGAEVARTTLDRRIRPGRGTRFEVGVEQAGLGIGDFDYTKAQAEYDVYFTVHESFSGERTILSLSAKAGYIPQDPGSVPTYERFRLGGRSLRGFDFQTVSPKGYDASGTLTDWDVGGTWSMFLGAQIDQPIYKDIFSIVGFIDTGTVLNDVGINDYRVSVGTGVRLYIPQLSSVPLALDFGFPIVKHFGDKERVFTLSVEIAY
ncbi:MAG: outer membrane protein assembly factor BamA [Phycisphaerales bacterium]|nr:outer membrane protein assembly factor BamA [Phycisphaerales bacterium]